MGNLTLIDSILKPLTISLRLGINCIAKFKLATEQSIGRNNASMKILALIFLASMAPVLADTNLLKNGNFENGINHWEGDCHTPDSSTFDPSVTAPASGVVVKLRHSDWTQVTQDFDGKVGIYRLSVTYTVSPGLKFSDRPDDYINVPGKLGYSRLRAFTGHLGNWVAIVNDLGAMHYTYWDITPKIDAPGAQTLTLRVQLDSNDDEKKGFYLVFPPGDGFITLQNISLTPATADTATAQ